MTALRCTAIIPTLHRPHDLEACLASLRAAQPQFEAVIVADQGDTQELRGLVESFGARYLHLDRRGISRARNAALAHLATPWCHFPDDDCTVAPDILARVAAALERHPGTGFVAGRVLTPGRRPVMAGMDTRERALTDPVDLLATVMSPGLFVAREVIERTGPFDERLGVGATWASGEESDFLFRALAAGATGVYAPDAEVTHPDPFAVRDDAAQLRRARTYGRGLGALFAKHGLRALQRRYETRALAGAVLAALTLRPAKARRHLESWRGRREGWRAWRP
jgi:GT2 family glycosyltransferase